jgi:hypothetical protein
MKSFDGMFSDPKLQFHLYYNIETNKQQLMSYDSDIDMIDKYKPWAAFNDVVQDIPEEDPQVRPKKGSDDGYTFPIDKSRIDRQTSKGEVMGWKNQIPEEPVLPNPVIELAAIVDKTIVEFSNKNEGTAQRLVHQFVNGVHAIYQPIGIGFALKWFHVMNEEEFNAAMTPIGENKSKVLKNIKNFFSPFFSSHMIHANPKKPAGRPDVYLVLTMGDYAEIQEGLVTHGIAHRNTTCMSNMGRGVIFLKQEFSDITPGNIWTNKKPRAMLNLWASLTMAHEIAHTLGPRHYDECADCQTEKGNCIMNSMGGIESAQWSSCAKRDLQKRIAEGAKNTDCLFTTDFYERVSHVNVPRVIPVQKFTPPSAEQSYYVDIITKYYPPIELNLGESILLQHSDDLTETRFFQDKKILSAFAHNSKSGAYSGHLHMEADGTVRDSVRMSMKRVGRNYVLEQSELISGSKFLPELPDKQVPGQPNISLLIGMDQEFVDANGGRDEAMVKVVSAVNLADLLFRQVGIRLRMTDFYLFARNHPVLRKGKMFLSKSNRSESAFVIFTAKPAADESKTMEGCSDVPIILIDHDNDTYYIAAQIAHEVGHLLGLEDYNDTECSCKTKVGTCLMDKNDDIRGLLWSQCDVQNLTDGRTFEWLKNETRSCPLTPLKTSGSSKTLVVLRVICILAGTLFLLLIASILIFVACHKLHNKKFSYAVNPKSKTVT